MRGVNYVDEVVVELLFQQINRTTDNVQTLSTQLWHHLDDSPIHTTTRWLPSPQKRWIIPTCHDYHWALIIVDHQEQAVIQMDSLHFDIARAKRVRDYLVKAGYPKYTIHFQQPIKQNDTNSCGVRMIDAAQQLAEIGKVEKSKLTREKLITQFGMIVEEH